MGRQHNELRRGGLSEAVTAAVGDTRGGGLERYGETLTPTMDLWRQPEWALLRHELLGFGGAFVALAAGFRSHVKLVNPADSGTLAVVEEIIVASSVAGLGIIIAVADDVTPRVTVDTATRDTRIASITGAGNRLGSLRLYSANTVAAPASITSLIFPVAANTPVIVPVKIVLDRGHSVIVMPDTDAQPLFASFVWRERRGFGGELV